MQKRFCQAKEDTEASLIAESPNTQEEDKILCGHCCDPENNKEVK